MPVKIPAVGHTRQNRWLGQRPRKTNQRGKGKKDRAENDRLPMGACRVKAEHVQPVPTKPSIDADGLERLKMVREFLHQQNVEDEEEFPGSPDEAFKQGEDVVISFPGGIHGKAWKAMVTSKGFVTTGVVLPKGTPGHGEHATWFDGKCYCYHLYGEKARWGCCWFERWLRKLQVARDSGCNLIVVARRDFSLGPSQKGILAWVEREGISVRLMSIDEFAVELFGRANGFTHMGRKILEMNASDKIDFHGSRDFQRSQLAIVSYPGAHGYGWNQLTQASSLGKHGIVTSCIFLPTKDSDGYGEHCKRGFGRIGSYNENFFHRDGCHCDHLYPFPKYRTRPDFGCRWYEMWTKKTLEARDRGCQLVVVTKQDGTLGNSQEGEVRFLRNQGLVYDHISISEFALMLLLRPRGDLQSVAPALPIP